MLIRQAKKQDLNEMADLLAGLFAIESDFEINRNKQLNGLNMLLDNSTKGIIFVAEDDEKVIAMCSLQYLISTAEGGLGGLIEDMVVETKYSRQGVGSRLIEFIIEHARNAGLSRIQLLADKSNRPALNFYKKFKFANTNLQALRKTLK